MDQVFVLQVLPQYTQDGLIPTLTQYTQDGLPPLPLQHGLQTVLMLLLHTVLNALQDTTLMPQESVSLETLSVFTLLVTTEIVELAMLATLWPMDNAQLLPKYFQSAL
jgi:hypothetical protein